MKLVLLNLISYALATSVVTIFELSGNTHEIAFTPGITVREALSKISAPGAILVDKEQKLKPDDALEEEKEYTVMRFSAIRVMVPTLQFDREYLPNTRIRVICRDIDNFADEVGFDYGDVILLKIGDDDLSDYSAGNPRYIGDFGLAELTINAERGIFGGSH